MLLALVGLSTKPAFAQIEDQDCPREKLEWTESRTRSFALIFTRNGEPHETLDLLRPVLQPEYERLAKYFGTFLELPVNLRLYPTSEWFNCLNLNEQPLTPIASHSRIGTREIALIENNIVPLYGEESGAVTLNILRYELGVLFGQTISGGKLPPGLAAGVGGYVQDPATWVGYQTISFNLDTGAVSSWHQVWDNPYVYSDEALQTQATSIVAYLVDVYGWQTFLEFLNSLKTDTGYREALQDVYRVDEYALSRHWQEYYPFYISGRWRANALYSFDLSPFEELVRSGAYTDASVNIQNAIAFLEQMDDQGAIEEAKALLAQAQKGQEAAGNLLQAREALLKKEYAESLMFAEDASSLFAELGNTTRLLEIAAYENWAVEALELQAEVQRYQQIPPRNISLHDQDRLLEVATRLKELGDQESAETVDLILHQANESQKEIRMQMAYVAVLLSLLLTLYLLLTVRRNPRPEVLG